MTGGMRKKLENFTERGNMKGKCKVKGKISAKRQQKGEKNV
jgi:hypothetical protein